MLYIFTDERLIKEQKQCINDIESQYLVKRTDIINNYEKNRLALKALKDIEGMTYHNKDFLKAKFGTVALDNISTGGKGCLLMALYHTSIALCTDEMGYNSIFCLCEMSKAIDVYIYSSAPYTHLPLNIEACINGELCTGEKTALDKMEIDYE